MSDSEFESQISYTDYSLNRKPKDTIGSLISEESDPDPWIEGTLVKLPNTGISIANDSFLFSDSVGHSWLDQSPTVITKKRDRLMRRQESPRPFHCEFDDCNQSKGFGSTADLNRHRLTRHNILSSQGPNKSWRCQACQIDGKDRNNTRFWLRLDNFRDHCRESHKDRDIDDLITQSELEVFATTFNTRYTKQSKIQSIEVNVTERCPHPNCGKLVKDIETHMLTYHTNRPGECPFIDCESYLKSFATDSELARHILLHFDAILVCHLCPDRQRDFRRFDLFKRHLIRVHNAKQEPPNSSKGPVSDTVQTLPTNNDTTALCPVCRTIFANAQNLYDHLDDCVLQHLKEKARHRYSENDSSAQTLDTDDSTATNTSKKVEQATLAESLKQKTSIESPNQELNTIINDPNKNPSNLDGVVSKSEPLNEKEKCTILLYLQTISEYITRNLVAYVPENRPHSDMMDILSNCLKLSALKGINYEQDVLNREIWRFFHCNLSIIAADIVKRVALWQSGTNQQEHHEKLNMSLDEKLDLWHGYDASSIALHDFFGLLENLDPHAMRRSGDLEIGLSYHRKQLDYDPYFAWLIRTAKRDLQSFYPGQSIMIEIQEKLLPTGSNSNSEHESTQPGLPSLPRLLDINLNINWDLSGYIEQQSADLRARGFDETSIISIEKLGQAITVTGFTTDAEALICLEYLDRTWPETGRKVLESVQTASKSKPKSYLTGHSIPGIEILVLYFNQNHLQAMVTGEPYSVVEVLQALVWLSSAFRFADTDPCVMLCSPSIHQQSANSFCVEDNVQWLHEQKSGQCWHKLLHNPTVVLGYPIRYRSPDCLNSGLEISLPIIASLIQSNKVIVLDGKLFLKGFSSMLVPTALGSDSIRWHYLYNPEGNYLPFDIEMPCALDAFDSSKIDTHRHIVGWCSEAKINVGSPSSSYTISKSRLEKPSSSIAFKGFSLSAGQFVSLGTSIVLGVRDPPVHVSPTGLGIMDKLLWMEDRFVVLWDSRDGRGWLVDGISALLHMLRASLKASQSSKFFKSAFKLKDTDIHESDEPYPQAAFDFFTIGNHKNLELELYLRKLEVISERVNRRQSASSTKTKTTSVLMQDRIEHLWEILAQIMTQQIEFSKREGCYWKPQLRESLEGWDFVNLACQQSPFEPVAAKMDCFSEPWIHFIRSINAVVLFGEGFGELIEPMYDSSTKLCSSWKTLPKHKNYLATTFSTLEQIQKRYGREGTAPMEISRGFVWHNPSNSIASCKCNKSKDDKHVDIVQVVWPSVWKPESCSTATTEIDHGLKANTALVFGQNQSFRWWQNLVGKFVRGLPPIKPRDSSQSSKRRSILEDTSDDTDIITTPGSSEHSVQLSESSTDITDISENSENSKRRKLLSPFPGLSFRSRSVSGSQE